MITPDLQRFVETAARGKLTRAERAATGASRATWLVDVETGGAPRALVLRVDTGDGPMSGTELTLAREAAVYAALAERPVRIPRLVAVRDAGDALLVERVEGSDAFAAVSDPATREALVRDCFTALAELHRLDPETLALEGFARPTEPGAHARADLRLWRRVAGSLADAPDPLERLAFDWLDAHAPVEASRTSLCHGDAGPGNFLFAGERVTALLDWEFAHLGDPLDDLAWVAVRGQLLGGFGDLAAGFRTWSAASGCAVVPERIEYYRALVLLRMAVSCRIALRHASARAEAGDASGGAMDTTVYALLLPYLRRMLPEALGRCGCDAPELAELAAEGRAAVEASPLLRAHARPLDPLPAA